MFFPQRKTIKQLGRLESLKYFLNNKLSIARFGDGELTLMLDKKDIYFQTYSEELQEKLKNVLVRKNPRILIGFNNDFITKTEYKIIVKYGRTGKTYSYFENLHNANDIGVLIRKEQNEFYKEKYQQFIKMFSGKVLGEATLFFLGFYYNEYLNNTIGEILTLYKKLFEKNRLLIVAPKSPQTSKSFKFLIENGIIKSHKSAAFIEISESNAFSEYKEILKNISRSKNTLDAVILQAGPTATVLAGEISLTTPLQAIDAGSLNESLYKAWEDSKVTF